MKLDKAVKLDILVAALLTAVGSFIFATNLVNMAGYVWILFASFTVTSATEHDITKVPNLLCSQAAGWVWAMVMYYICLGVLSITGSLPLGFFLAIFVGSIVMLAIHLKFLMGTWLNNISIIYTSIFCWFSIQDFSQIPYIVIALTTGAILAALSHYIQCLILKK